MDVPAAKTVHFAARAKNGPRSRGSVRPDIQGSELDDREYYFGSEL